MNDKQARIGITLGDPAGIGHRREGRQRDERRDAGADTYRLVARHICAGLPADWLRCTDPELNLIPTGGNCVDTLGKAPRYPCAQGVSLWTRRRRIAVEPFVSAERFERFIQHVRNLKRFVIDDPA
jgi:hypothetical protein